MGNIINNKYIAIATFVLGLIGFKYLFLNLPTSIITKDWKAAIKYGLIIIIIVCIFIGLLHIDTHLLTR